MAGLEDLGSMLGMEPSKKPEKRKGYDGNTIRLRVRTEKRRGKLLSIIWGFKSHPMEMNRLLTLLKKQLGAGGQIVDATIELQGDHVARVIDILSGEGYSIGK